MTKANSYQEDKLRQLQRKRDNAEQQRLAHEHLGYEERAKNAAEDVQSRDNQIAALKGSMADE